MFDWLLDLPRGLAFRSEGNGPASRLASFTLAHRVDPESRLLRLPGGGVVAAPGPLSRSGSRRWAARSIGLAAAEGAVTDTTETRRVPRPARIGLDMVLDCEIEPGPTLAAALARPDRWLLGLCRIGETAPEPHYLDSRRYVPWLVTQLGVGWIGFTPRRHVADLGLSYAPLGSLTDRILPARRALGPRPVLARIRHYRDSPFFRDRHDYTARCPSCGTDTDLPTGAIHGPLTLRCPTCSRVYAAEILRTLDSLRQERVWQIAARSRNLTCD